MKILIDKATVEQALEALEEYHYGEARIILRQALEQPAQEPVAWVNTGELQGLTLGHYSHVVIYTDASTGRTPLYTTPPQRPWVGLTDEEIAQGNKESWVTKQAWESAVWWASEKLKEKNNGT